MLTLVFDYVKAHWLSATILASVVAVFATLSIQYIEIGHLKNQLAQFKAENIAYENANKALAASIEMQNSAIVALQAAAAQKAKKARKMLAAARADTRQFKDLAKQIQTEKVAGDECEEAKKLVENYIGN